jgi:hypothetical protein
MRKYAKPLRIAEVERSNSKLWTTAWNSSRYENLITALTIGNNRYRNETQ